MLPHGLTLHTHTTVLVRPVVQCLFPQHLRQEVEQAPFCWRTTKTKWWRLLPIWDQQKMMLVECSCHSMFMWSSVPENCSLYFVHWLWSNAGRVWHPQSQGSGKGSSQWDSEKNTGIEYLQKKNTTFYHLLCDLLCTVCEYSQRSRNKPQSKHRPHRITPETRLQT